MSQVERPLGAFKGILVTIRDQVRTAKVLTSESRGTTRIGPPLWVAILVYGLLSVLMTWPLIAQLGTHFPTPDTDVFNAYWSNWWFRQALANGQNPYVTDYLLYPMGFDTIAFGFSPFLAVLWLPLTWFLPALAAFNLVFLLTIVLTCLAMDQLVRYLTGNAWAALVAGITFGFAPSLVAERLPHVSKSALFWIPWALLVLTRLVREARVRDAFLLAAIIGLAFLTLPQVGILVVMSCGIYSLGLVLVERKRWHRLAVRRLLLACLLSLLVLTPVLGYAWQSLLQPGGEYLLESGAEQTQTDLLAYVVPPQQHPLFGSLQIVIDGQRFVLGGQYWVYLGLVPLALALYAAVSRPREALPWLLTGSVFFVLALGPYLRFNGEVYPAIRLPYSLAPGLFSAAGFNTPNRFNMGMMAAVSVLVGLACAYLDARFRRSWLPGIAALLILGEYLVVPLPTVLPPPYSAFYEQMAADKEDYAIVDLPLTRPAGEVHRFYQTIHQKPLVGGWVKRVPASAFDFINANPLLVPWKTNDRSVTLESLDSALAHLSESNVRYIVIHKNQLTDVPESMRVLLGTLRPVYSDSNIMVLPVESASDQGYHVVQWFGEEVGLIRPIAFVQLPEDGRPQQLSLAICWLRDGQGEAADRYQLALTGPDGVSVLDETATLPSPAQGLTCNSHNLDLEPTFQTGEYSLDITPFSRKHSLGTYTTTQAILGLSLLEKEPVPAMGSPCYVAFDAAIELLGYNLMEGDGFAWIDLYWRSTAAHQRTYPRTIHLIEASTGQSIAQSAGTVQNYEWEEEERFQERMVLWLGDALPDETLLGIKLDGKLVTDGCRADLLVGAYAKGLPLGLQVYVSPISRDDSGETGILQSYPGLKGYDGRACLVVPEQPTRDTEYLVISEEDPNSLNLLRSYFPEGEIVAEGPLHNQLPFFLAFRVPAGSTAEIAPSNPLDVNWGNKIRLLGYDIDSVAYGPGDELHLTLYYQALEEMELDYTLFAHVVGLSDSASERPLWGQDDSEPCRRSYPTLQWMPGEIIRDEIDVLIADDAPPGDYELSIGFYLWETLTRLPVTNAAGLSFPEDAVPLGRLRVEGANQP